MHDIFLCLNIWETGLPIVGEERQSKKYQKDKDQFPPRKIKIADCLTSQYSTRAGLHFVSTEINWKWNHYLNLSNLSYQQTKTRVSANTIIQFQFEKEHIHLSCKVSVVVTVVDIIKSKYFVTILNFLLNLKNW